MSILKNLIETYFQVHFDGCHITWELELVELRGETVAHDTDIFLPLGSQFPSTR